MDVLKLVFNFLFGSFVSLWNYFSTWWTNALDAGFEISPFELAGVFLPIALILGSGFAAMTFAEMKYRHRGLHFVGGVVFPVVYPLIFFYLAPKVGDNRPKDEMEVANAISDEDELEESNEDSQLMPESEFDKIDQPDDPVTGGFPEPATPVKMGQEFFARISRLEDGTPAGPFTLELVDGTQLGIISIVDAMPAVLSVEMEVDGETRKIRLPYEKIKNCVAD